MGRHRVFGSKVEELLMKYIQVTVKSHCFKALVWPCNSHGVIMPETGYQFTRFVGFYCDTT
jgi:hypothetical protein